MATTGVGRRTKISVNLQKRVESDLAELVQMTGLTQSEIIQDALKIYKYLADDVAVGRQIFSIEPDGGNPRELVPMIQLLGPEDRERNG